MTIKTDNTMEKELLGKIALITGGREGMGRATGELLASKGATVILVSRNQEKLQKTVSEIIKKSGNKNIFSIPCDVEKTEEVQMTIHQVINQFKRIDYLIHFAGYNLNYASISEAKPSLDQIKNVEKIVNTDLLGTARFVFGVEPIMRQQKEGMVIVVGSTALLDSASHDLIYQIAKSGNQQMIRVISKQHQEENISQIKLFLLAPGPVYNFSTYQGLSPVRRKQADQEGWLDSYQHVAPVVYWLLTHRLKRESGSSIRLDTISVPQLFQEVGEFP